MELQLKQLELQTTLGKIELQSKRVSRSHSTNSVVLFDETSSMPSTVTTVVSPSIASRSLATPAPQTPPQIRTPPPQIRTLVQGSFVSPVVVGSPMPQRRSI